MKKKVSWHTSVGFIDINQQSFRKKKKKSSPGKRENPFEEITQITNRSYSKRCQKLVTDFGIEESFQSAAYRMKEHHGVDINVSAIRTITEFHARRAAKLESFLPQKCQRSKQMIVEMDGEMVPLVEYKESKDNRKTKKNLWSKVDPIVKTDYS